MEKVKIPEPFLIEPFFSENDEIEIDQKSVLALEREPLLYDIYRCHGIHSEVKPWEDINQYFPILLQQWQANQPIITEFFRARDRVGALEPMKRMVKVFLALLFWSNRHPVPSLKNITTYIQELNIKPVNVEERISYILSAPNHHHAFTQLKELFIELEKKYAVAKLKAAVKTKKT
ncbi:MAG: YpoC family protein [Anaerobacillus sp.]|uniref:YpoC family protein n=1 Tax=Anaerobacillus sp. TaxID=1872506 RepID=UPI00391DE48A